VQGGSKRPSKKSAGEKEVLRRYNKAKRGRKILVKSRKKSQVERRRKKKRYGKVRKNI